MSEYVTSDSRSSYYRGDERVPSRLWAAEKALHDLAEIGLVDFFEGPGPDPTAHPSYASGKIWLKQFPGVQTLQGTFRAWNGNSPVTSEANWPELNAARFFQIVTGGITTTVFPIATQPQAEGGATGNVLMDDIRTGQAISAQVYPTRAALLTQDLPPAQSVVTTSGYDDPGDDGGAEHVVSTDPAPPHAAYLEQPAARYSSTNRASSRPKCWA